ncbi:MAG: DUF4188 domain-containing protein [Gemmatimonadaceae bacterium]
MARIVPGRMMGKLDGDFVVFLIGMRVNRWWKFHKWVPVATAMPRMIRELQAHPECGCLGTEIYLGVIVQYWRSFDHLEEYARSKDKKHFPAWTAFNRNVRSSSGDVGIWHETYLVHEGEYETVYGSMPRVGLARAGEHLPVTDAQLARERLRATSPVA